MPTTKVKAVTQFSIDILELGLADIHTAHGESIREGVQERGGVGGPDIQNSVVN